ncbi:hypothetical protein FB562_2552 [Homoserinimonas aerilata]|uniref:Uncharacterized protein n=1 Tax=Homoserinimonas aerilata TaxID=1162970 RepID=A0A542Y1M0_9MICO|nr:hypothetical protein [Homoserinimonas aerilata]TQL41965.1 hypothetical protein FB562_2552 [Homoserinimonas aerilata]
MAENSDTPDEPINSDKPVDSGKPNKAEKPDKPSIPPARIGLWVIAGGIGVYFLATGLIGLLTGN